MGGLTEKSQEEIKEGKQFGEEGRGRRKGALKLTGLTFFQEMGSTDERHEWIGSGGFRTHKREEKGKQGSCGPQVFTGECAPDRATECWGMKGDLVSTSGRGQITRGIQSPGTALSSCPDVGRIWVLGDMVKFQGRKKSNSHHHRTPPTHPHVSWVIAGEYSNRMPR